MKTIRASAMAIGIGAEVKIAPDGFLRVEPIPGAFGYRVTKSP